jgi:hypothetical protein
MIIYELFNLIQEIMRYIMQVRIPIERGNELLKDPKFGEKMSQLLTQVKAEQAYFTTVGAQRGGFVVLNMDDASQIPLLAEPFFLWLEADIEFLPVMTLEDLQKAGPGIGAVVQKWG